MKNYLRTVDEMLAEPGRYLIPMGNNLDRVVFVEVAPGGTCYQLSPSGARDGILDRKGWSPYVTCVGPLAT